MIGQIEIPESFPGPGAVSGKRVVITGASRGLGALLAHAFSHAGASVALVARTERDLKAVAEALPGPSLVLSGDVTDEDFNESVADATVAEWGGVDAWICNAGISPIVAGPRETDASVWRQVLEVNLTGAFLGARAAARVMGEGGRLIFTGSVLGERPRKGSDRVQRLEGRAGRHGQGPRARSGPGRHHGERRGPGVVRFADGRRVEEATPSSRPRSPGTPRNGAGGRPPTWPAPTSSWPPTPPRSSPAPCSASTADTCSYDTASDGSWRSPEPGGALGAAVSQQLASEPATDLVLSDVSATFARGDRRRPPPDATGRSRRCSPT